MLFDMIQELVSLKNVIILINNLLKKYLKKKKVEYHAATLHLTCLYVQNMEQYMIPEVSLSESTLFSKDFFQK